MTRNLDAPHEIWGVECVRTGSLGADAALSATHLHLHDTFCRLSVYVLELCHGWVDNAGRGRWRRGARAHAQTLTATPLSFRADDSPSPPPPLQAPLPPPQPQPELHLSASGYLRYDLIRCLGHFSVLSLK